MKHETHSILDRTIPSPVGGPILPPSLSTSRGQFRAGYIDAMLWANSGVYRELPGDDPSGDNCEHIGGDPTDYADLPAAIRDELTEQADDFLEANAALIESAIEATANDKFPYDWSDAGHDLALTRNHHGAGFWDRGLGAIGDGLTEMAHAEGELYISVSIDRHGTETWAVE